MKKLLKFKLILFVGLCGLLALTGCATNTVEARGNNFEPIPPNLYVFLNFADSASISSWAYTAVNKMQANGIMSGTGNNNFSPGGDYTREQSIITMLRLFDRVTTNAAPVVISGDIYVPSSFGMRVSEGSESLVEFTVLSKELIEGVPSFWSWDYHNLFILHIDDVLLGNNTLLRWSGSYYYQVLKTDDAIIDYNTLYNWPSKGEEISIISHASVALEEGQ